MKKRWLVGLAVLGLTVAQSLSADAAKITYKEYNLGENISITVPYLEGSENKKFEETLNKTFLNNARNYLAEQPEDESPLTDDRFDFRADYEVPFNSFEYVSIVQWYHLYTGGAHGNTFYSATTFNTITGEVFTLKDLFKEKVDYRVKLTLLVEEEFASRGEHAVGFSFTEVTDKTLFYLTPSGLVLLFPPYEIAPFVVGDIRVHIPWWKLQGILNEEFPVH